MKVQRCKGTRDLSAEEMSRFRLIEKAFIDCCLKSGYREVRTPTLEYMHLFTSAGTLTPGMLSKVYSFLDWDGWSGERVVLKPDGTIPVARLYIDSMEDKDLARLFYVTNIFIFEETGKKDRERWQCGAELIGAGSPVADAELISLSLQVLKALKLECVELRLSHAGLIKSLVAKLGLAPEEQARVFDQILDGNAEALARIKAANPDLDDSVLRLLSLKGQSSGFLKNLKALSAGNLSGVKLHLDDFIATVELIDALGGNYQVDIASGAGFEYYTGVIFQLFIGDEKIGGGGRYDDLIPSMGGGKVPASGFALYLDRLMGLVKPEILPVPAQQRVLVRANSKSAAILKEAFNVASDLRRAGYVAELDLNGQEPTGLRWVLNVQEGPLFVLEDQGRHGKFEAGTVKAILKFLGEKGADKGSPA